MTAAQLRLAMAAMGQPGGTLRPDGQKLLARL
jgi:hypothetical protein